MRVIWSLKRRLRFAMRLVNCVSVVWRLRVGATAFFLLPQFLIYQKSYSVAL
jgi:hypothetical protein